MRIITVSLAGASALALSLAGCSTAGAQTTKPVTSPTYGTIEWQSCDDFAVSVADFYEQIDVPSPLNGLGSRLQCAEVGVPLDYSDPMGKQISIAVTKLAPKGKSAGYVFTNPGGPGIEGRTMPAALNATAMASLADTMTVVGIDPRGTGGSTAVNCAEVDDSEYVEEDVTEATALEYSKLVADANRACVESDPEFVAQLTTQNTALDLDRVRDAIGVEKVSYFGVSWGTELGIEFLNAFPERIERMLLDSVMDVRHDAAKSLDDVAEATAKAPKPVDDTQEEPGDGADGDALAAAGTFTPGSYVTRAIVSCNAYGATDAAEVWAQHVARTKRFGTDLQDRAAHPISGSLPGTSACVGWPLEKQPLTLTGKTFDDLQLVEHTGETVTPDSWAQRAHELLGGHLAAVADGQHGSLAYSDKAEAAVKFLVDGTPIQ